MAKKVDWIYVDTGMLPAISGEYEVSARWLGKDAVLWLDFADGRWWLLYDGGGKEEIATVYAWRPKPVPAPRRKEKEQNG